MKICTTLTTRHASDHRCYPVSARGATERLCNLAEDQLLNYDTTTKNDFEMLAPCLRRRSYNRMHGWLFSLAENMNASYSSLLDFIRVKPTAYGY